MKMQSGLFIMLALSIAGVVLLRNACRRDIQAAYQRLAGLESHTVDTECGPIQYAVRGKGYPVLVVHGISGGFDQGIVLGPPGSGFKVIAPSRFGYLGTPLPDDATPASQADAFACLLDELGIDRAVVMAYSAGGTSAIQFALRYPERTTALILISSTAPSDEPPALPPEPVIRGVFGSDFAFWLMTTHLRSLMAPMMGVPRGYPLTPEEEQVVADHMRAILPVKPRREGVMFDMFISNLDMSDNPADYYLEEITAPTLVIYAVDDPLANYEDGKAMSQRIPNARFVSVPQGGHLLLGADDLIETEMMNFLQGVAGEALARP